MTTSGPFPISTTSIGRPSTERPASRERDSIGIDRSNRCVALEDEVSETEASAGGSRRSSKGVAHPKARNPRRTGMILQLVRAGEVMMQCISRIAFWLALPGGSPGHRVGIESTRSPRQGG
jgi:hypothetical protein